MLGLALALIVGVLVALTETLGVLLDVCEIVGVAEPLAVTVLLSLIDRQRQLVAAAV